MAAIRALGLRKIPAEPRTYFIDKGTGVDNSKVRIEIELPQTGSRGGVVVILLMEVVKRLRR